MSLRTPSRFYHFVVPCAVVFAFFGIHVLSQLSDFLAACERGGDFSVLLLNVEKASRFEALVGPYSRYKVAHPGPIIFYVYAFFELVLGDFATPMGSAMIAQVALNAFFSLLIVSLVWRKTFRADTAMLLLAAMVLAFENTRVPFLHYIWNPAVLLFPCVALLLSAAVAMTHLSWFIVAFVLSALVMGHHHIAGAGFAAVIGLCVVVVVIVRGGWREVFSRQYCVGYLVILICSVPVLFDAFSNPRLGNVGRVFRHLTKEKDALPIGETVTFLGRLLSPLHFGDFRDLVVAFVLFGTPWLLRLEGFEKSLRLVTTVACAVGFLIVRGLHDLKYDYMVWFLFSLTAVQIWLVVSIVLGRLRVSTTIVTSAGLLCFGFAAFQIYPQSVHLGGNCEPAGNAVANWTAQDDIKRVKLELVGRDAWGPGAAIVNNLLRSHTEICIEKKWGFMFGRELTCGEDLNNFQTIAVAPPGRREGTLVFDGGQYVVTAPSHNS